MISPAYEVEPLPEAITGADAGGGPHVKVFDGKTGAELTFTGHPELTDGFYAYDPRFGGGVRVAVGDVNGDGHPDIITGAGPSGGPHVHVFDATTLAEIPLNNQAGFNHGFMAFDPSDTAGIYVAAGDINGDGKTDIIVSHEKSSSQVEVISGADGSQLMSFDPFPNSGIGVRVASTDLNGDGKADIIVSQVAGSEVKSFSGADGTLLDDFMTQFTDGLFVGAGGHA
jgi:hypothetical protein